MLISISKERTTVQPWKPLQWFSQTQLINAAAHPQSQLPSPPVVDILLKSVDSWVFDPKLLTLNKFPCDIGRIEDPEVRLISPALDGACITISVRDIKLTLKALQRNRLYPSDWFLTLELNPIMDNFFPLTLKHLHR